MVIFITLEREKSMDNIGEMGTRQSLREKKSRGAKYRRKFSSYLGYETGNSKSSDQGKRKILTK